MKPLDFRWLFLSGDGRLGRYDFWLGTLMLALIASVFSFVVTRAFGEFSAATRLLLFVSAALIAYPQYALLAKRLHDRGYASVYVAVLMGVSLLGNFVLLVNPDWLVGLTKAPVLGPVLVVMSLAMSAWIFVELGLVRGTRGPNAYGPDPVG